jgi:hypothetical protein
MNPTKKLAELRKELVDYVIAVMKEHGLTEYDINDKRGKAVPFAPCGGTIKGYTAYKLELIDGECYVSGDWKKPQKKINLMDFNAGVDDFYALRAIVNDLNKSFDTTDYLFNP